MACWLLLPGLRGAPMARELDDGRSLIALGGGLDGPYRPTPASPPPKSIMARDDKRREGSQDQNQHGVPGREIAWVATGVVQEHDARSVLVRRGATRKPLRSVDEATVPNPEWGGWRKETHRENGDQPKHRDDDRRTEECAHASPNKRQQLLTRQRACLRSGGAKSWSYGGRRSRSRPVETDVDADQCDGDSSGCSVQVVPELVAVKSDSENPEA